MTKLAAAFRNFANAPKDLSLSTFDFDTQCGSEIYRPTSLSLHLLLEQPLYYVT